MAVRQLIITNPVDNLINGIPENTHSWGGKYQCIVHHFGTFHTGN